MEDTDYKYMQIYDTNINLVIQKGRGFVKTYEGQFFNSF